MASQSVSKNKQDLNDVNWSNLQKLVTGAMMKQFLLNWLESTALGELSDGTTIQYAIDLLRQQVGNGTGSNSFDTAWFKVDNGFVSLAYEYLALSPREGVDTDELEISSDSGITVTRVDDLTSCIFDADNNRVDCGVWHQTAALDVLIPAGNKVRVTFKAMASGSMTSIPMTGYGISLMGDSQAALSYDRDNDVLFDQYGNYVIETEFNNGYDCKRIKLLLRREGTAGDYIFPAGSSVVFTDIKVEYWAIGSSEGGLRLPVGNLLLTKAGMLPELPPDGSVPGDEDFNLSLHIIPGQFCLNIVDNVFYYNNGTEIKIFNPVGSSASLPLNNPAVESPSGTAEYVKGALSELVANGVLYADSIRIISDALANIAAATMKLDNILEDIPTTEERILYVISDPSNDDTIIDYNYDDVDPDNNYFMLKKADYRYQLRGNMVVYQDATEAQTITFRLRSQEDDSLIAEYDPITVSVGNNQTSPVLLGPDFIDTIADNTNVYITYENPEGGLSVLSGTITVDVNNVSGANIVIDDKPTPGSENPPSSGGVYDTMVYEPLDVLNDNDDLEAGYNYALYGGDGGFTLDAPGTVSGKSRFRIYCGNTVDNDVIIEGNGYTIDGEVNWTASKAQNGHIYEFIFNVEDAEWTVRPLDSGGESKAISFSETISIENANQYVIGVTNQSSAYNFVKGAGTFINGVESRLITTNGNTFNFSSDFIVFKNDYSDLDIGTYLVLFSYLPNGKIGVVISNTGEDLVSPEIESVIVENEAPANLVVTFNENISITDLTGLSLNFTSGTAKTIQSILSGSGTSILTFVLSADIESGDEFTLEITSENNIVDDSGNGLQAASIQVINNVAALEDLTWNMTAGFSESSGVLTSVNMALPLMATKYLPASTDGEVLFDVTADTIGVGVKLHTSPIATNMAAGDISIGVNNTGDYYITKYTDTTQAFQTGDKLRLRRTSGVVYFEVSTDGGNNWIEIDDTPVANSGALYVSIWATSVGAEISGLQVRRFSDLDTGETTMSDVDFTPLGNFSLSGTTYTSTGSTGDVSVLSVPENQNFKAQIEVVATSGGTGLKTVLTQTDTGFASPVVGLNTADTYYVAQSTTTTIAKTEGDLLSLHREWGVLYFLYSQDNGVTWNRLATPIIQTAQVWLDIYATSSGKVIENPQAWGLE